VTTKQSGEKEAERQMDSSHNATTLHMSTGIDVVVVEGVATADPPQTQPQETGL